MTEVYLGYEPKEKFKWKILPKDNVPTEYNGKQVVWINILLWEKIKNMMRIKDKGFDTIVLIDGPRRGGKSTLAKVIAYLLDPDITIKSYVSGIEEAPKKIFEAENGSVLIFDEGTLVASSKDALNKGNKQLEKIIEVVGQKKLSIIFCMPQFHRLSRMISVDASQFLLRVLLDKKTLRRGEFRYYSAKKKERMYNNAKNPHKKMKKVQHSFGGKFKDFKLPFEEEYLELKIESLQEALGFKKKKVLTENEIKVKYMNMVKKNMPNISNEILAEVFETPLRTYYDQKAKLLPPKSA